MVLLVEAKGSVRWTTRRPSFAIVTMLRHRLTFLILVIFLEGCVPYFKCAKTLQSRSNTLLTSRF